MRDDDLIVLTTERITLHRLRTEDVDQLYELDGDPEVMRFLSHERTPFEVFRDQKTSSILQAYELYQGFGHPHPGTEHGDVED